MKIGDIIFFKNQLVTIYRPRRLSGYSDLTNRILELGLQYSYSSMMFSCFLVCSKCMASGHVTDLIAPPTSTTTWRTEPLPLCTLLVHTETMVVVY